jgi:uncharacterized protein YjaZ
MPEGLRLHVLTASGRLLVRREEIEQRVRTTFTQSATLLELSREPIDVVVRDAPQVVIPEIRVGGFAPDRHTIFISIDPEHPRMQRALEFELARTVAHELDHVGRHRSVGYGTSLCEAIVSEELADHFSVEVVAGQPPVWSVAVGGEELEAASAAAALEGDDAPYDHARWFFGKDSERAAMPRWAGYSIGWKVVGSYLECHPGLPASELINLPADVAILRFESR